jgi:hypothetical protein
MSGYRVREIVIAVIFLVLVGGTLARIVYDIVR